MHGQKKKYGHVLKASIEGRYSPLVAIREVIKIHI
jgi:hypothetical protein